MCQNLFGPQLYWKVENRCFPDNFAKCFGTTFSLDASGWLLLILSLTENILCFYRWIRIHFGFSWHNFYWDNDVNDKKLHTNNFPFFKRKHPSRGVPKIELKIFVKFQGKHLPWNVQKQSPGGGSVKNMLLKMLQEDIISVGVSV